MKKYLGILFALVLAVSLMLVPAVVSAISYDASLTLDNKDETDNWVRIDDNIGGTLLFNSKNGEFEYKLTATNLVANTAYSLIYYADYSGDRYGTWGGDNPGALIAEFTTGEGGNINGVTGSVELNMSLPCLPDANMSEHSYCGAPDYYSNCHGAKIWLVPSSAITPGTDCWGKVTAWPPTDDWLFETDLICYTDTDPVQVLAETCVCDEIVGCSVTPNVIDFGYVTPGQCNVPAGAPVNIVVTNTSTSTANPLQCTDDCVATDINIFADVTGDVLKVGLEYNNDSGVCNGLLVDDWDALNVAPDATATMTNIKYDVPGTSDIGGTDIGGTVTITCVASE